MRGIFRVKKVERQSNIKLLRNLTMSGVVVLHYNNENIGKNSLMQ